MGAQCDLPRFPYIKIVPEEASDGNVRVSINVSTNDDFPLTTKRVEAKVYLGNLIQALPISVQRRKLYAFVMNAISPRSL